MDKHLDILTQLYEYYWNKGNLIKWKLLHKNDQHYYIKWEVYTKLKN